MTVGYISARFEPVIPLTVRNDIGVSVNIEVVLDNGEPYDTAATHLADGQVVETDLYVIRAVWQGSERIVIADSVEGTPLIGMAMLQDLRVMMDVRYLGEVSVAPIPEP